MTRVKPVSKEEAKPRVKEIYQNLEKKLGRIPNIFLNMGNSESVLKGYLALGDAAEHSTLDAKLREQIALIVSQKNDCNYCLSAHTAIAKAAGLNEESILQARQGFAQDPKAQAIINFAKIMVEKKGHVTDQEVNQLKEAGVNDAEVVDIILVVIMTMFTNYFNHVTDPKIDFPIAPELALKK